MAKELLHILQRTGLRDKAARLYLAGLETGSAPASDYAKLTELNRITAYTVLEDLARKGFFTTVKKERAKWYAPVPPEYILLEARKNTDALERILPELRSLQKGGYRKPRVRFFDGWEGVKKVYEDTLAAGTEILNFANSAVVRSHWPTYDQDYVAERVRRGIYLRGIAPNDDAGRKVRGENRMYYREIRLVSGKEFDFTNEINIYDHKVAICSFGEKKEMFGVIIESKEVAETQRQIFEMAWRFSGTVGATSHEKSHTSPRAVTAPLVQRSAVLKGRTCG